MKKGFVLLETIIVISIICVILIGLYGGYSRIILNAKTKSTYDNTEYIYKTKLIADFLKEEIDISNYWDTNYYIYCSSKTVNCENITENETFKNLNKYLKVEAIYITVWNTNLLDSSDLLVFEPTTQKYIKQLDPKTSNGYRIIAMFRDRTDARRYQYASLRFASSNIYGG